MVRLLDLDESVMACQNEAAASKPPTDEPIRLLLVDDQTLFRESLGRLLGLQSGFELAGDCSSAADALEILHHSEVDIVLLDLCIGAERCDSFIAAARNAGYRGKFLIVTSELDPATSAMALRSGASGIFLQSESSKHLIQAIRLVANGAAWVDPKLVQLLADRYFIYKDQSWGALTEREQNVLQGVLDGLTNKKIGDRIGASESTIKATLQQLFTKVGVRRRSQLVRAALGGSGPANPRQKDNLSINPIVELR